MNQPAEHVALNVAKEVLEKMGTCGVLHRYIQEWMTNIPKTHFAAFAANTLPKFIANEPLPETDVIALAFAMTLLEASALAKQTGGDQRLVVPASGLLF